VPVYPKERFSFLIDQIPENVEEKIFCLFGDVYLCEEAAKKIITKVKEKSNAALERIYGDEVDENSLKERFFSFLFGEQRLIWVKDLTDFSCLNPEMVDRLPYYLIITTNLAKAIPKWLKEKTIFFDFSIKPAGVAEQRIWQERLIDTLLGETHKTITTTAKSHLLDCVGFNLFALKNNLELLINYIGEKDVIDNEAIDMVIIPIKEEMGFALGERLGQQRIEAALNLLKNLLEQGFHPLVILGFLTKEWRCLFEAKLLMKGVKINFSETCTYNQFLKMTYPNLRKENLTILAGLHPYVVYSLLRRAFNYSLMDLFTLQQRLLFVDRFIKTNTQSGSYYLEMLILFWSQLLGGGND
jgi:DNA polymerase-3 subunit delta